MPQKVKRECSQPGCRQLTTTRYCEQHAKDNDHRHMRRLYDRLRSGDPYRAEYNTARWKRVRVQIIYRDPLCKMCGHEPSTVADHIIPARHFAGDFYDEANLQGLCKPCHDHKTATEDSDFARERA